MCCGGKCLFFISFRTGSLIFGYISAIISGAGTIACTIASMFTLLRMMYPKYNESINSGTYYVTDVIITTVFLIELLSGFICSVLLLVGITQNKPSLVKTYLIYGILQVVLLLVFFIIMHFETSFFLAGFLFLVAVMLGLYTLCLYMVFMMYQPMIRESVFVNPRIIDLDHASVNAA